MQTGYIGRLAAHEGMVITEDLASMIRSDALEMDLRKNSRDDGMLSLFEDGMAKALKGRLSIDDILRELPKSSHEESIGDRVYGRHVAVTQLPQSDNKKVFQGNKIAAKNAPSPTPIAQINAPVKVTKPKLLLVEDSPTMRDYISYILRKSGKYDVVDVSTGEEALGIIFHNRPSMIITDQRLPGINGTSLIATVRSNPDMAHVPIILLTSEEKIEIKALRTGADSYIAKPVDPELLLARVEAIFASYQRMQHKLA